MHNFMAIQPVIPDFHGHSGIEVEPLAIQLQNERVVRARVDELDIRDRLYPHQANVPGAEWAMAIVDYPDWRNRITLFDQGLDFRFAKRSYGPRFGCCCDGRTW